MSRFSHTAFGVVVTTNIKGLKKKKRIAKASKKKKGAILRPNLKVNMDVMQKKENKRFYILDELKTVKHPSKTKPLLLQNEFIDVDIMHKEKEQT